MVSELFPTPGTTDQKPHRATMKAGKHGEDRIENLVVALAGKPVRWTAAEAVTAGELLLTNAARMDAELFIELWSRFADEVRAIDPDADRETPDQQLVRAGELRLLAGWLLQPSSEAPKLAQLGRKSLIAELHERTDTDGTPHAELAARMPLWLAPLIRATLWAENLERPLWSDEDRRRLALVLERAIPLCRPDGRLAMTNGLAFPAIPLLTAAAKSISLGPHARKLLESLRNAPPAKPLRKKAAANVAFMPSNQSDWARFAVLRSDWSPHADSLAISHHQSFPQLDVAAGGVPILHGEWNWELQIGDAAIAPAVEWAASSWFSDPDADYLELQMAGPGNLRVERQVLLSRKEQFLLLADVVRGARSVAKDAAPIHLRSRLPLADGVVVEPSLPTRELKLKARKQTVRVFPLALPMERVHSTPHSCVVERNELVTHHVGVGNGLYAPLIFDWHPARTKQPAIWRTLTVTEAAKVLPRDQAGGHRLQLGKFQLLIYRSLSKIKSARAVLGCHTWQESIIANFNRGKVEPIVRVDE